MPRITSHRLSRGQYDYEIEIGLDDAALMDNALEFEVVARRSWRGEHPHVEVPAKVSVDLASMTATVRIADQEIGKIDLAALEIPEALPAEDAWNRLKAAWEYHGAEPLEEALQAIPVPDPVFGCLLKAGLTTTLGQTMKCYDQVKGASGGFRRVRRVFVCLAENGVGMIWTATSRSLRCMAMLGFG